MDEILSQSNLTFAKVFPSGSTRRTENIEPTEENDDYEEGTVSGYAVQRKVSTPHPHFIAPLSSINKAIESYGETIPFANNYGSLAQYNPIDNLQAQEALPKVTIAGNNAGSLAIIDSRISTSMAVQVD